MSESRQADNAASLPLRLEPLTADDVTAVELLYNAVLARAPHGHLADRAAADFASILADERTSASIGAWHGDTLIGFTLSSLHRGEPVYAASPLMRHLQARGGALWTGKGTVIDPAFEGRLLMSRMLKKRGELIAQRGAVHTAGLIATTNLASLAASMRAGAWIVGMERDEYCENFVCYSGAMKKEYATLEPSLTVRVDDLATLGQRLASGWIGARMDKGSKGMARLITMLRLGSLSGEPLEFDDHV